MPAVRLADAGALRLQNLWHIPRATSGYGAWCIGERVSGNGLEPGYWFARGAPVARFFFSYQLAVASEQFILLRTADC